MSKLDLSLDSIKAEQGMWFVQSDIRNIIAKLKASNVNKNEIIPYQKLHAQAIKLTEKLKRINQENRKQ